MEVKVPIDKDKEAKDSANKAVDGDRLLPGEDPKTPHVDDAVHWLSVYTELLQAKAAMLAALSQRLSQMKENEAQLEVGKTDVVVLERELARFQGRLDFWKARKTELESSDA